MTKVARMYYEQNIRQQEITERLNIHQSTVSRLLKKSRATNLVRISVAVPPGVFSELEEGLETRYKLKQAIVVDTPDDEPRAVRDLGAAAAFFIETSVKPGMVVGISSWSLALLAMLDTLHQSDCGRDGKVVQILGGMGSDLSQYRATQLANNLAQRIGAVPVMLTAPAVVGSTEASRILQNDPGVQRATSLFNSLDIALVGIGAVEPSPLLAASGNAFSPQERAKLTGLGAVGHICLRYFDAQGKMVKSPLNSRVIGIELETLRKAGRVVAIAGGTRRHNAIRAALLGGWINVLVVDKTNAERLLVEAPATTRVLDAAPARTTRKRTITAN